MPPLTARRPLFEVWPGLEPEFGFLPLGDFPTPVERLALGGSDTAGGADVYVKRDDLSSMAYGGNKVRTLEPLLGQAWRQGNQRLVATGAYGSNHAVATLVHGQQAGFRVGVVLFPQPYSATAEANLRVSVTHADEVTDLWHWSLLPRAIRRAGGVARPAPRPFVMPPGGAIPRGCLGFMSAALELCLQIDAGAMPRPDEVAIALGSTCSTAGLLVGLRLASRLGLGFGGQRQARDAAEPPLLVAVRVTPWPLTSAFRILRLAQRVARCLFEASGDRLFAFARDELARGLEVDGSQLGAGYGRPTAAGLDAIEQLSRQAFALDTSYSAKSAAALLARRSRQPRVRLYWCTKSSAPLPPVSAEQLARVPSRMRAWMERGAARSARLAAEASRSALAGEWGHVPDARCHRSASGRSAPG